MLSKRSFVGLFVACVLSFGFLAGCGGGGGGSACGEWPMACDDDPTGSYQVVKVCGVWPMDCPEASNRATTHSATGSLTLSADGSASLNMDLEYYYSVKVPDSCGLDCEVLDDLIGLCDQSGDQCVCEGYAGTGQSSGFSWRLEGGQVILEYGDPAENGTLCTSGDTARTHFYDGLELLWERTIL